MFSIGENQSRRTFLKHTAQFGFAGAGAQLVCNLDLIGRAAAATANDYKAMVCVFLYGGNDNANTLPPYDAENYAIYRSARESIAIDRAQLAATALTPETDLGGRQFALHPSLAPLKPVFDSGKMAILPCLGTLIRPITKLDYYYRAGSVPPQLFSHVDQYGLFQTGTFNSPTIGWGGRIGDLLQGTNATQALTCISASGRAAFIAGPKSGGYSITPSGPLELLDGKATALGSQPIYDSLVDIMTNADGDPFSRDYAAITKRALDLSGLVRNTLGSSPESLASFPQNNSLADQLEVVLRMISVSQQLGLKRQVFFVSLGGFDHHSGLPQSHPSLLNSVGTALRAFYDGTVSLGVADNVVTFTASDFGRTLTSNGDGTEHGWGSAHFVIGGGVQGRKFYGRPAAMGVNTSDDVEHGRIIPTVSVDQYAATLATWFGVTVSGMPTALPNIGSFNTSSWNLGFV